MNGTELEFLEKEFKELKEKVTLTHDAVLKLPCAVQEEKIKGLGKSVDRAWSWIYGIVISCILTGAMILVVRTVIAK